MSDENRLETRREAYEYGRERNGDGGDWEGYTQSADYSNNVLPKLRRMAGYSDSGGGTYTVIGEDGDIFLADRLIDDFRDGWMGEEFEG